MIDVDVAVVGGGISGLTAARELCGAGLGVLLLERDRRCGGVIRTDTRDGFVLDAGPDTLLAHKPAALTLCRDLALDDALIAPLAPRTTYLVRRGRLRALPDVSMMGLPTEWKTLVTTRAFSWLGKVRMAAEQVMPRRPVVDESLASFIGRRFGREAVTFLAEPLLAGIHRGDASRLSVQALFPSLAEAERTYGSVVRSWRAKTAVPAGRSGAMSLRGGLGQLVDRLREALPPDVVRTSSEVESVDYDGGYVTRIAGGPKIRSWAVVLALPAYAVSRVAGDLEGDLGRLCDGIEYVPSVTVSLGYRDVDVPSSPRGWSVVVPAGERMRTGFVTWVSSKWPHRAPAGHVLLRASLDRACAPQALHAPDALVIDWVARDLRPLFGIRAEPVIAQVHRRPRAMPQLEVGHLARMAAIDARLARRPGLFVTAAGFRGVGLPDCVADATATARQAIRHVEPHRLRRAAGH